MSDDQCDGAAVPTSPAQVIEVAREVTRQLAPEELPKFDDVVAMWSSGSKRPPKRVRGPGAGFGLESALLCQLLFPIIAGAIGQVLGTVAMEQIQPRHRGRHSAGARRDIQLTSEQAQGFTASARSSPAPSGRPRSQRSWPTPSSIRCAVSFWRS